MITYQNCVNSLEILLLQILQNFPKLFSIKMSKISQAFLFLWQNARFALFLCIHIALKGLGAD
jgi:hypothetical protein